MIPLSTMYCAVESIRYARDRFAPPTTLAQWQANPAQNTSVAIFERVIGAGCAVTPPSAWHAGIIVCTCAWSFGGIIATTTCYRGGVAVEVLHRDPYDPSRGPPGTRLDYATIECWHRAPGSDAPPIDPSNLDRVLVSWLRLMLHRQIRGRRL